MSTAAQMKKLVAPLLARNPDLVLAKRVLYLRPVSHILRYVRLQAVSNKERFEASWGIVNLLPRLNALEQYPSMDYGYKIRPPREMALWYLTNPLTQEIFSDTMERDVLPRMRAVKDIQDFVDFTKESEFSWAKLKRWYLHDLTINVALGNLDAARATCEALASNELRWELHYFPVFSQRILSELWPALQSGDRPRMAEFLRSCEAHSVKALKLEKYWEPTPFPIELM
jgi:hypothetical protein